MMKTSLSQIGCFFLLAGIGFGIAEIQVDPGGYDFGLVNVGSSESVVITIYNLGDTALALNDVYFEAGSSGYFAVTSFLYPPVFMGPGAQFPIEITFAPAAGGAASASLLILSTDVDEAEVRVWLTGHAPSDKQTPAELIAAIIDFVEESVQDGALQGEGPGKSADNHLNALQNMLDRARKLIEEGLYGEAGNQLESVYKKTDGQDKPGDFVQGTAASGLAEMILELLQTMEEAPEAAE